MKLKTLTILIIVLFLSSSTVVSATKIQKDDTWVYEDKLKVKYDETALDVIAIEDIDENPISVVSVETNRTFVFPIYDKNTGHGIIDVDLDFNTTQLYLTQEGGIPYIPKEGNFDGKIYVDNFNLTLQFDNSNTEWIYKGDPSISLTTTSSSYFEIGFLRTGYVDPGAPTQFDFFKYIQRYLITSNSDMIDKIKNFTITPTEFNYELKCFACGSIDYYYFYNSVGDSGGANDSRLQLNSFETAVSLTYEEGFNQPTYIAQAEPIKINGLQLSQSTELVEYFLVILDEEQSFFPVLSMLIIIPMIIKYRKLSI